MIAPLTFDWSPARNAYERILAQGPAPLEQDWNYGEALATVSRNDVRRALICRKGVPVAAVQAVHRRLPAGLRLVRIVRGPVVPPGDAGVSPGEIGRAVRAEFPRWSRTLLFWMPDLSPDRAQDALRPIGKRPMTTAYSTAWADLSPAPDELRKRLRGNWRNQLKKSEAAGLEVRSQSPPPDIDRFVAGYVADRRRLGYRGPDEPVVHCLFSAFGKNALLLQARSSGTTVAAALFLRHAGSATYFLSWTTPAGRQLCAANLLIWRGMLHLRRDGIRWLDIGGLSAAAPGIAAFKLGIGIQPKIISGTWF